MRPGGRKETIALGGGCYWCLQPIFRDLKGVENAVVGYAGGHKKDPTYEEVCTGTTGHAEVVQVTFFQDEILLEEILRVFFTVHDPTTLNRQGADVGTQYRSIIFYHNEKQKKLAEAYKKKLDESGTFKNPIVTAIEQFKVFYKAEDYHQDYYNKNPNRPYCMFVIRPKLEKFEAVFESKLK